MTVAYDGSGFHGFAPNPGVRTVGGTLGEAIRKVTRSPVELTCAGRTDTGVHAWGQVVSFDLPADRLDPAALPARSTASCTGHRGARPGPAPDDFDARRSAVGRTYRYTIVNRPVPDPFLARDAWHVAEPLRLELLRLGCDPLVGEHDFSAFCRKPSQPGGGGAEASLVRHVRRAGWTDLGDGVLRFEIEANAFCHQMIRSVVGTLVDVGAGPQARRRSARHPGRQGSVEGVGAGAPAGPVPVVGVVRVISPRPDRACSPGRRGRRKAGLRRSRSRR